MKSFLSSRRTSATLPEAEPVELSKNFVVRSLRRRLWKACQDDDATCAMAIYKATQHELEGWLHQEYEARQLAASSAAPDKMKATDSVESQNGQKERRSFFRKRSSKLNEKDATLSKQVEEADRNITNESTACNNTRHTLKNSSSPSSPVRGMIKRSRSASEVIKRASRVSWSQTNSSRSLQSDKSDNTVDVTQSSVTAQLSALYGTKMLPVLPLELLPSECFLPDDFLDPYGSYEYLPQNKMQQQQHQRRSRTRGQLRRNSGRLPRLAGFGLFRGYAASKSNDDGENDSANEADGFGNSNERTLTTPLHEAARLGSHGFMRALLDWGGDPNIKNGMSRTALHMVAGGLTASEESLARAAEKSTTKHNNCSFESLNGGDDIDVDDEFRKPGIRAPKVPPPDSLGSNEESRKGYNRMTNLRSVGRLIKTALCSSKAETTATEAPDSLPSGDMVIKPDPNLLGKLRTDRMEATVSILSWTDPKTGEGPSINAVDSMGRTALHYAAELGRDDVCMAILSKYDAILTIVDELGATPCELAAEQGHPDLAAQLEARAILYCDPYGADDDMMAAILAPVPNDPDGQDLDQGNRASLVPPFSWFDTLSMEEAREERVKRLQIGLRKMKDAVQIRDVGVKLTAINTVSNTSVASAKRWNEENEPDVCADEENDGAFEDANITRVESFSHLEETHVELFLSHYKWNLSAAMDAFRKDPFNSFKEAGIPIPSGPSLTPNGQKAFWKADDEEDPGSTDLKSLPRTCLICYDDNIEKDEWKALAGCDHGFCSECLREYVSDCAGTKSTGLCIPCPHHECQVPLSPAVISELLSLAPDVQTRLMDDAVENCVSCAFDMRFCPYPGCSGVVLRKDDLVKSMGLDSEFLDFAGAVCTQNAIRYSQLASSAGNKKGSSKFTYEGVDDSEYFNCRSVRQPRKAHRFCFSCGEEAHWPVTCERLEAWKQKVREEIEGLDDGIQNEKGDRSFNDLAQKLWIKANTRPCPQCNVAIEKNDGCNHMTCTNPVCRHEFCWICRKDWKLHGTATGGFFRCNIWEDPDGNEATEDISPALGAERPTQRDNTGGVDFDASDEDADQGYGSAIYSARSQWKQKQLMARFLHHYTRWNAHAESAILERKMCDSVCSRLSPVVNAACEDVELDPNFNFGGKGLSFVHAAFTELLECRSVLQQSYALSFFRYPAFTAYRWHGTYRREEKSEFERLQSELEVVTEQMSDIVARSHIRATQVQITLLTNEAAQRRVEFSTLIFKVLREERNEKTREESEKNRKYKGIRGSSLPMSMYGLDNTGRLADGVFPFNHVRDETFLLEMTRNFGDFPGFADLGPWACPACTLMNSGGRFCEACGTQRRRS